MNNKERIVQLIDNVDDNKLYFVVNILESLKAYANEEIEPDEFDLAMIAQAKQENNSERITLDDLKKELNIEL